MTLAAQPARAAGAPHLRIAPLVERTGDGAFDIALVTTPEPGWHGYWGENPGDAGFPPKLEWSAPAGARFGPWRWPTPTTLKIAGLMNYVYDRPFAPMTSVRLPAARDGPAPALRLHLDYLVCTASICVPEQQTLEVVLAAPVVAGALDQWRAALPRPLGSAVTYQADATGLRIAAPYPASAPLADPYLFPATAGAIDYAAPQTVTRDGDRVLIATTGKPSGRFEGVLRVGPGQAFRLIATPGVVAGAQGWMGKAAVAFAFALLGGVILNVMPCVFPILSLKALGLVRSGAGAAEARREALAYAAGVVLVCVGLGAAILLLRAGGSAVGWAFQLQSPRVLVVLLLLSVALALNLAGLFEFATPRFAARAGSGGGAFATGALAAFVATPCTGPFMGAALGAALVLPWPAALAVFAGLGLGLALPFLLLGFVPALRRRLPRPGGWMETFRRVLSVPMWLTAIALAWVLGRQAGVDGLTIALVAALFVGLLLWMGGARQHRGRSFGWVHAAALAAVAALGSGGVAANGRAAAPAAAIDAAFSEARLASLRAQGRPVFAYFTADWCLTCKVNERVAIEPARAALRSKNVAVLVGDWTDGDPALGRFIEAHNRAGVPLYLYYAPGQEGRVLPQVLTPGMLAGL